MSSADLTALMETQIERPAAARLLLAQQKGLIREDDVAFFHISVKRYRSAVLAGYEDYDIRVRDELLKSLLADYQQSINGLVERILRRSSGGPSFLQNSSRGIESSDGTDEHVVRSARQFGGVSLNKLIAGLRGLLPPRNGPGSGQ